MKLHPLFVGFLITGLGSTAWAQEPAESDEAPKVEAAEEDTTSDTDAADVLVAVPDRPTFSFVAATVPAGHVQLEVGGEVATSSEAKQVSFPLLARVGLAESFEVRAGLPAIVVPLSDSEANLGALQLGAKVAGDVTDSLSLGALPYFDIAAGSGGERTFSQSTYGFHLLWGVGFSDAFGISGTLGAAAGPGSTDEAGPRELFYSASLAASVAMGDAGITGEGFTILGQFDDPVVGGSLSAGYAIFDTVVVDVYGGTSAQSDVTTFFAGAGLTIAR